MSSVECSVSQSLTYERSPSVYCNCSLVLPESISYYNITNDFSFEDLSHQFSFKDLRSSHHNSHIFSFPKYFAILVCFGFRCQTSWLLERVSFDDGPETLETAGPFQWSLWWASILAEVRSYCFSTNFNSPMRRPPMCRNWNCFIQLK